MATAAIKAHGTKLIDSSAGTTPVTEVTSITGPGVSRTLKDVTAMDSATVWQEFIGTVVDAGEITAEVNYVPTNATHQLLISNITASAQVFQINFIAATAVITATSLVSGFSINSSVPDELTASFTLKVTGAPTFPS